MIDASRWLFLNPDKKQRAVFALKLLLAILGLIACFQVVDFEKTVLLLGEAEPAYVVVVMLIVIPMYLALKIAKWSRFAKLVDAENSFVRSASPYLLGMLIGVMTPGRVGEVSRVVGLVGKKGRLIALTLVDRVIDLYVVVFLSSLSFVYSLSESIALTVLSGGVLVLLYMLLCRSASPIEKLVRRKMPGNKGLNDVLFKLPMHLMLSQLVLTTFIYLLIILQFLLIVNSFGVYDDALIFRIPVVFLSNLLPLTIGGFGVREGVFLLVTRDLSVPGEIIVNSSLLWVILSIIVVATSVLFISLVKRILSH